MAQIEPAGGSAGALDPTEDGRVQRPSRVAGLGRFTARRLLTGLGTLLFVLVVNFFLFQMLARRPAGPLQGRPGDLSGGSRQASRGARRTAVGAVLQLPEGPAAARLLLHHSGQAGVGCDRRGCALDADPAGHLHAAGHGDRYLDRYPGRVEPRQPVRQGVDRGHALPLRDAGVLARPDPDPGLLHGYRSASPESSRVARASGPGSTRGPSRA